MYSPSHFNSTLESLHAPTMWRQINKEGKPFFGIALSDPADFEKQDFKPKLEDKIEDGF